MNPVELFLALRFLKPNRSYVSIITLLSLLGVMLSVMVLIVVLSVMEGFQRELRDKIVGFNAHITVLNYAILQDADALQKHILEDKRVAGASPFVVGPVLSDYQGRISTPFIRGIRSDEMEKVVELKKHLIEGEWLHGPDEIVVGRVWAKKNDAVVGETVMIYSPRTIQNLLPERETETDGNAKKPANQVSKTHYLPNEYKIAGIFSTDMFDYDANFFLIDLMEAQRLYSLEEGVHGIAVKLHHIEDAESVKKNLNQWLIPPTTALTWMDQNRQLFSAIEIEKIAMSFCLFFIMLVAAFGICSTLITIIVQKAKEIGLMKALGAKNYQICAIFTIYGFVIGIIGSSLGVLLSLVTLEYRNSFRFWLARTLGMELFPAAIYNFAEIPAVIDPIFVFLVALSGVLLSTLAALLPALRAAKADPVQTLRRE